MDYVLNGQDVRFILTGGEPFLDGKIVDLFEHPKMRLKKCYI